jgi:tetratricopeptide (TPR) repeat protein
MDIEALLQQGNDAFGRGHYEEAITNYEAALELNPTLHDGWLHLGRAQGRLGRSEAAITSLDKALGFNPCSSEAWNGRGAELINLGRNTEAFSDLDKALKFNPNFHLAWKNKGAAWFNAGNYEESIANYEESIANYDKALELNPNDHDAWRMKGNALYGLKRYEEACSSYDQVLELKPDDHNTWYKKGHILYILGNYEEAIANYDQVLELKPDDHNTWYWKGNTLHSLGRYEEAITSYEKALNLKPDDHDIWHSKGDALYTLNRYEEAISSYDKALELKPELHSSWYWRGIALAQLGQLEEAITSYEKALDINPDDHNTWYKKGNVLSTLKQLDMAISSYEKAIELNPKDHEIWNDYGRALSQLKRHEEAITSFEKATELKPDFHESWHHHGTVLSQLERNEAAIISFEKSLEIQPDCYRAWYEHGLALSLLGQYGRAIASYRKVLELKSDHHETLLQKGSALSTLGYHEEAIASYDEVLRLTQNQSWTTWELRGFAVLFSQDYLSALATWQNGIEALLPTHPDYRFGCGKLFYRKGCTQYSQGSEKLNPFFDWLAARESYLKALDFLSFDDFPLDHLTILQELLTFCPYLLGYQENLTLLQDATAKLQSLLQDSSRSISEKFTLKREFAGLNQLQVDALAQSDVTQALELAEKSKNLCLKCLRKSWEYKSPPHVRIQTLLGSRTAAIYWHLSPAALTTFILKYNEPPQVFQSSTVVSNSTQFFAQLSYPPTASQFRDLENWIQRWKQGYLDYRDLDSETEDLQASPWRELMEDRLFTQLSAILGTNRLYQEHLQNIDQLILIPHRDLHLIPLHTLFPECFTITYLPSAQLGLELADIQYSPIEPFLLSIEDPATQHTKRKTKSGGAMMFAEIESALIAQQYDSSFTTCIPSTRATQANVTNALCQHSGYFHFTGHSEHDIENPEQSALALTGEDLLTLKDIFKLDLHAYSLVCLSSCETGITSTQGIIDEYIGLVSGFLSAGVAHVVSTLWTVDEISSALLMIQFHEFLNDPDQSFPPAKALSEAQKWLRNLTCQDLADWYQNKITEFAKIEPHGGDVQNLRQAARINQKEALKKGLDHTPYAHPFFWAGFTITGKVPNQT